MSKDELLPPPAAPPYSASLHVECRNAAWREVGFCFSQGLSSTVARYNAWRNSSVSAAGAEDGDVVVDAGPQIGADMARYPFFANFSRFAADGAFQFHAPVHELQDFVRAQFVGLRAEGVAVTPRNKVEDFRMIAWSPS